MENNEIRKISEVMDEIEVGMNLVVHNERKKSTIGGYVEKKILKHDPETHEEYYHIELDVDGNRITLDPDIEYLVLRLTEGEKELTLEEKIEQMIDEYGLDPAKPVQASFLKMVDDWGKRTNDERELMAMALERFLCYDDVYMIINLVHVLKYMLYQQMSYMDKYRSSKEGITH